MYVTTSRCDDYLTSMNSQEAIKKVQSAPYQIFTGTNCSGDLSNTYRYKKVSVAEPPNLMPHRSACLPLDTKHSRENTKLLGSIGHT